MYDILGRIEPLYENGGYVILYSNVDQSICVDSYLSRSCEKAEYSRRLQ